MKTIFFSFFVLWVWIAPLQPVWALPVQQHPLPEEQQVQMPQYPPYFRVTGTVVDVSGSPIAYATVALLREGEPVKGVTADSSGVFELNVPKGGYELYVRHLAYQPHRQALRVPGGELVGATGAFSSGKGGLNVGMIVLEESGEQIRELVVTGAAVTREADRFVMRVAGVTALAGKDGAELLARAPGVWLNDSGLSINGAKGTQVYVNDRLIKLSGEDLRLYLQSLNAADVLNVEVIPQAGAEYSADMKGGVIRITLSRRMEIGVNGRVQLATSQSGNLGAYAPSGSVSSRIGKWTLNAALSGNFIRKGKGVFEGTRKYDSDDKRFASISESNQRRDYVSGRLEALVDLNKRHHVGVELAYSGNDASTPLNTRTDVLAAGEMLGTNSRYEQQSVRKNVSGAFNYLWRMDTLGSLLKMIGDYSRLEATGNNRYQTTFEWRNFSRDSVSRNLSTSTYDLITGELALEKVLPHGMNLKTGLKYSGNRMKAGSVLQGETPQGWREYPDYGYYLNYRENIGAAYLSLSAKVKRWDFSAGLRGEYTNVRGNGSQLKTDYFKLFPSVSVSWALNEMRTWMLVGQYSRNIERPSFFSLNPTRIQTSDYGYQVGNPYLRPAYVQKVSMTAVFKYRYTLTVGANLNRDLIREVCKIDPADSDVSYIIPENHYREDHYFIALNAPFMLAKWCNLTVNAVGVRQQIRFTKEAALQGHYLLFVNSVAGFTLPGDWYAELSYDGHSRLYSGNSEVRGRHVLNASVKKHFAQGRFSASLAVQNLTGSRNEYVARTSGFVNILNGYTALDSRYVKVSVSYHFRSGNEFKARRVENAGGRLGGLAD